MSLIDDIVDVYQNGPSNWSQRLRGTIDFISPEGNEHSAKWIGGRRNFDKKLGIFIFPKVRGNLVQDLDVNSTRYTIPVQFDGVDNDLNAQAFFQSLKERGIWTVTHPVHGVLELQLLSVNQIDEPVTSGGITTVETEWIEPIDEETLQTAAEAAATLEELSDNLSVSAAQQFADNLDDSTEALANSIDATVRGVANVTDFILSPLTSSVDALSTSMNLIQNGINDTLNATVLDVLSLGGQIQELIEQPALATTSLAASQTYYTDLANELISSLPSTTGRLTAKERNEALIAELALMAALSALSRAATASIRAAQEGAFDPSLTTVPTETRAQAVAGAQETIAFFKLLTDQLELIQEGFETETVDDQYFAQLQSYNDAAQLTAQTVRFLLISSFDLKVERRFVLDQPRNPLEIAVTEYGGFGEGDSNIDLFIRSNELTGNEIYLLPAGREVVVYA